MDANRPGTLEQLRERITTFREHYNYRRSHRVVEQATPRSIREPLEHAYAVEPIRKMMLKAVASSIGRRDAQADVGSGV
ncbi:hypothetical protein [Dietzia sp. Die43]|uniref:hypothetical protein n=1 Tax=Dietzia sp. Die43 TaxID=2926011 RepID=UPI0021193894|nr:hypothetical protein [Dietzia sp. Die43]